MFLKTGFLASFLAYIIANVYWTYIPWINAPPAIDIGMMTQNAATNFFNGFQNPYSAKTIIIHGQDPAFAGFKYGPFMIFGYFLSAFNDVSGFKIMNLFYIVLAVILLAGLAQEKHKTRWENLVACLFVSIVFLTPDRLWYELFVQGANDIFPTVLVLWALWCVKKESFFWAGLTAGLSLSAKFAPAFFFIALFARREINLKFLTGLLLGMIPLAAFFLWDPREFFRNVLLFHAVKLPDVSSLYSLVPKNVQFIFPVGQLVALVYFVARNFNKKIDTQILTAQFILLLILAEVLSKEIHANHLIFFIPFIAVLFTWRRYAFLPLVGSRREGTC